MLSRSEELDPYWVICLLSQATCVVYTQTSRDSLHFLPLVKVVKANLDMSKANFWWTDNSLLVVFVHCDLCFCTAILSIPSMSWFREATVKPMFRCLYRGDICCLILRRGIARTQSPTNKNYVPKLPTFGAIVGVNSFQVQWTSLTLGELPSWSQLTPAPGKYATVEVHDKLYCTSQCWFNEFVAGRHNLCSFMQSNWVYLC